MITAGLFALIYGKGYDLSDVIFPAIAPAVYLCALAMLVNNISGSYWVAAGAVSAYWLGEMLSGGVYTQLLYLFNHTMPFPGVDPAANRVLLIIAAGAPHGDQYGF